MAGKPNKLVKDEPNWKKLAVNAAKAQQALKNKIPVSETLTAEEIQELSNRYSHFEDKLDESGFLTGGAHVVTSASTPRPYLHLMSSNHSNEYGTYGSFWDQSGAGFSCLDSVLAGPVTSHKDVSYVPTIPKYPDHRRFYLREEGADGVDIWYAFPQRGRDEDDYSDFEARQGLGFQEMKARSRELDAELLVFVPVNDPLEVWRFRLTNNSGRTRKLKLFNWVNWGLESYPAYYFDPRVVSQGYRIEKLNTLIAVNHDQNNKHPRAGYLMASRKFEGFDMAGEDFTGAGHDRVFPRAVVEGHCRNSMGTQPYLGMIAAMQFELEIKAGQTEEICFILGATDNDTAKRETHLEALHACYFGGNGVEASLKELESSWNTMVSRHMAKTPDMEVDRFFNLWSKYQAKNTARWTRALDMVGYRDLLQDLMGINAFNPEYTTQMLPTALRYQLADGRAIRQFAKFKGAHHDLRMYMDSSSWIADTLVGYLEETGDWKLLDRLEGFFDMESGNVIEDEKTDLYDHALRGIKSLWIHRGLHGLCHIGHGDWNDALDGVSKKGEGVSVWLSMSLVFASQRFRKLAQWKRDTENVKLMDEIVAEMTANINKQAWDGAYYVYAFMPDGTPVGSKTNEEGKIHLNVNAWSLFNGVAEAAGRVDAVLNSIETINTPVGHLLIYPSYTHKSRHVGRIADALPGQFENGSIYTHGQSFVVYALAQLGRGDEAMEALKRILPSRSLPDITTGPLHQVSNYTVGIEHEHFGRNLYSNFSGALSWLRKSLERMLGVLPVFDGLVIDPVVPSSWKSFEVVKHWRGTEVHVKYNNDSGKCRGVANISVDGKDIGVKEGHAFIDEKLFEKRKKSEVIVTIG